MLMTVSNAFLLPLALPYLLLLALGGNLFRFAFVFYALATAVLLLRLRRWLYPAFIIALFAYSPFLRRVADVNSGFVSFNLVLIAPYFALLATLPSLFNRLLGKRDGPVWPYGLLVALLAYGVVTALLNGAALTSALYEPIRWLLPITLSTFIMEQPGDIERIRRSLVASLFVILPIIGLYGVYQYLVAPPWDVFWMVNLDNSTFGLPEPFRIRVFSMLNAPFSAGAFTALAMIILAGEGVAGLLAAGLALPMLALTLVRTAWFGLAVGLAVLFLGTPASRKISLAAGATALLFALTAGLASAPMSQDMAASISDRLATFQDLKTDGSAAARLDVYDGFYQRLADYPLGEGFGAEQTIVTLRDKKPTQPLDSGVLETYLVFGVVGGTFYFAAVLALAARAFATSRLLPRQLAGWFAAAVTMLAMSFLGSAQNGEVGALGWAALGVVIAHGLRDSPRRVPLPASYTGPT